jgi:hypothetical protein
MLIAGFRIRLGSIMLNEYNGISFFLRQAI